MTAATADVAKPVEQAEPTVRSAQQMAEEEGLTFAGTPGPGYSEGGDVYEPKPSSSPTLRRNGAALARGLAVFVTELLWASHRPIHGVPMRRDFL